MLLETVRLTQREKEQLLRVKRDTGIKNWNVLCRWALCLSLAEKAPPPATEIRQDSNVEMTWRVFGGVDADIYTALVRQRCREDGMAADDETAARQFRLHLQRGIGYLFGNPRYKSLEGLLGAALT